MKFLCVPCDQPMKLREVAPPDRGSLSVRYACERCGHEMAMLTNPHETQLVQSLGVKVGPAEAAGGCPFTQAAAAAPREAGVPWTAEAELRLAAIPEFVRPMAREGIERFARERGYARVDGRVLDEARSRFGM